MYHSNKGEVMSNLWTLERTFSNYAEALEFKNTLTQSSRGATLQVKIKRYSSLHGVERYGVKTRSDPSLAEAIKHVEEKVSKKKEKTKG
jgi:hypothetical protein